MRRMATHLEQAFAEEHERTYGHRAGPDEPVELVSIQLIGVGPARGRRRAAASRRAAATAPRQASRHAYFGDSYGWLETPMMSRADLAAGRAGPLIVEEYDATCGRAAGAPMRRAR